MNKFITLKPTIQDNWLYTNDENDNKIFTKEVILGKEATPWKECTNEQKIMWEEEHNIL